MTGRSGASPMPPATITTSLPSASSTGQLAPNGPRRPTASPRLSLPIAFVTAPTARTVCVIAPGFAGSPLIETGTSPTPKPRPAERVAGADRLYRRRAARSENFERDATRANEVELIRVFAFTKDHLPGFESHILRAT